MELLVLVLSFLTQAAQLFVSLILVCLMWLVAEKQVKELEEIGRAHV